MPPTEPRIAQNSLAIAIALGRHATRDDAPRGVVIAFLIFVVAAVVAAWIVNPAEMTKKTGSTKKPPMPNKWAKLPAADVDALVAYMQSLK